MQDVWINNICVGVPVEEKQRNSSSYISYEPYVTFLQMARNLADIFCVRPDNIFKI
jgi:hypothetical protein